MTKEKPVLMKKEANSTTVAMISDLPVYWPSFYISISQVNLH
ncbi:hypothetical protein PARMER_03609 [Parabacteroides merdae ATCC 43184]|nr:hypothetical protein PARMER_03609 [Parabacteroides merdae ATCC 43184]